MISRFSFASLVLASALLAGGVGGVLTSHWYVSPQFQALQQSVTDYLTQATTTTRPAPVEVVRVEREPAAPIIPDVFLQGRRSPEVVLIRKAVHGSDADILTNDRVVGGLVSLTVDGWLLAPASLFDGVHLTEVEVVSEGHIYPITQAIRDTATDLVYVKITAQNLPVVGFTPTHDVGVGLPIWVEGSPGRLIPQVIVDVRERSVKGVVTSERISRRYLINAGLNGLGKGSAVWNGAGQLVGVIESSDGTGARVIPAAEAMSVLSPLLTTHEIRRATLGASGIDLSLLISEGTSSTLGVNGFVLRGDRAHALMALDPKGPSAKSLKEGDVIERLDRDVLDGSVDLGEILSQYRPGTILTLYGRRAGKSFEASVTLGSLVTSEALK